MNWPAPGIHHAVPFADYRADDITQADTAESIKGKAVSKSLIVSFIEDPGAWKASPPKKQTKAMKGGSLFDCLLTEPHKLATRYVVSPYADFRTNESKAWRDEQEANGLVAIKESDMESARAQLMAVMSHPSAAKLINGSQKQVAFRHKTRYGFDSKGLIDIVPTATDTLVDIKTCEPRALESRRSLQRHLLKWNYHYQAGAYCEGYSIASGEERSRFKFIFVTSSAPFRVAVIELEFSNKEDGAKLYFAGMKRLSECFEADRWPGMWDDEILLGLPEYGYTDGEVAS